MFIPVLFSSLFISAVSFVGAAILFKKQLWEKLHSTLFVSFAAGVMLAAAFLDLLPESLEGALLLAGEIEEGTIFLFALLGVVVFFFLERFVLWFHHHHEGHGENPSTILVFIGDGVHNFIDGVAVAAAFLTDPSLGIITTLAIAAHEIPQEIADLSVLVSGGMKKSKALLFNFISGLTAVAGAIIGYLYLEQISSQLWVFLAFTAGMFIYISCSDLIPELHKDFASERKWKQSIPFLLGIALMYMMIQVLE